MPTTNSVSYERRRAQAIEEELGISRARLEEQQKALAEAEARESKTRSELAFAEQAHLAEPEKEELQGALARRRAVHDASLGALAACRRRASDAGDEVHAKEKGLAEAKHEAHKADLLEACSVPTFRAATDEHFRELARALDAARGAAREIDRHFAAANRAAAAARELGVPAQPLDEVHAFSGLLRLEAEEADGSGLRGIVRALEGSAGLLGATSADSLLHDAIFAKLDALFALGDIAPTDDVAAAREELLVLLSEPTRHRGIEALRELRFRRGRTTEDLSEINRRRVHSIPPPKGFVNPGAPPWHVVGQPTAYQRKLEADAKKGVR